MNRQDWDDLARLTHRDDYPGFARDVIESPNGDGVLDREKRYSHIAPKYLQDIWTPDLRNDMLWSAWLHGMSKAHSAAARLGVPGQYLPSSDSTMRVLFYPAGAGSALHTDFCLFTLSLFREPVEGFRYFNHQAREARRLFPGIHFGELWTEITGEPADAHHVRPLPVPQRSIVFFAMPPLDAVLPSGVVVADWLKERKDRSRVTQ